MGNFEATLKAAGNTLCHIELSAKKAQQLPATIVPSICYEHWERIARNHSLLVESIPLFLIRETAFAHLKEITSPAVRATSQDLAGTIFQIPTPILFCGQIVPFATARHMALASYLAASWSLYDRLAIFCGRLIGPIALAKNPMPKRIPKLVHAFIRPDKDGEMNRPDGFALGAVLPPQWEWSAVVCYKIRNLVLHDGVGMGGGHFFESDEQKNGFILSDSARIMIREEYSKAKEIQECDYHSISAGNPGFPWFDNDLRTLLEKYHDEIDMLFERLIRWGVAAFENQFRCFTEPDKQQLAL